MMTRFTTWSLCPVMVMVVALSGCGTTSQDSATAGGAASQSTAPSTAAAGAGATDAHEHKAPHGGALVELGEELAHLEIVLAASTGTLTAHALDGEAEQAVRLAQPTIEIVAMKEGAPLTLTLRPVANELTGERAGDTSQFTVTSPDLRQLARFEGRIQNVSIRGQEFRDVAFRFPEGSEH